MKVRGVAFAVWLCIFFSPGVEAQTARSFPKKGQPNIIFILTDDLGYGDVGVLFQNRRKEAGGRGEPLLHTPQLDKLAAGGALLPHHYTAAPVCAPARASFLLGVHQGHANVRNNQFDKALEDNHTTASLLRTAGYRTAVFGKWGLQGSKKGDWPAHPLNRGFDHFMGMMRHGDGHEHYPKEGPYRGSKEVWENRTNIAGGLDKCYTTDLWTAAAKKWIIDQQKSSAAGQPFFIYLAYETPHAVLELPTQAYPKGGGLKGGVQWVGTPGRMINTASGTIDSWVHPDYAAATWDHDKDPATAEVRWPEVYQRYATSVRRIDDAIGDLMQLLRDLKLEENTLVVFSSDNGPSVESYLEEDYSPQFFNSFGPFDGIKRDVWEGGVRVPTIAYWPRRIAGGTVVPTPSGMWEWGVTFADAAGVAAPARLDGVSLLPALAGKAGAARKPVYVEYFHKSTTPSFDAFEEGRRKRRRHEMQLVRLGDTLGVRYDIGSAEDDFEIYHVVRDPKQARNLAASPGMDGVQDRLKALVLQMRRPDTAARRPYDEALVPAVGAVPAAAGICWKAVEGDFPWVPDIEPMKASRQGVVPVPGAGPSLPKGAVLYSGFIDVPRDGMYTFYLRTGSAALLRIHEATVVDADYGYTSGSERSGTVRLKAGLHPFRLYHTIKGSSGPAVELQWSGDGISKQPVPAAHLKHGR